MPNPTEQIDAMKPLDGPRWSKEAPTVDGVYWWRADSSDFEPDIHRVVGGIFFEVGEQFSRVVEGFGGEWLGPITPEDAEQLVALRTAVQAAQDFIEAIAKDIHYVYSPEAAEGVSHAADSALSQLRAALYPKGETKL